MSSPIAGLLLYLYCLFIYLNKKNRGNGVKVLYFFVFVKFNSLFCQNQKNLGLN